MAHINRKYIDSHWSVFILRGLLALLFGWLALFNSGNNLSTLTSILGVFLLSLSIVEFANSLYRAHYKRGWGTSVAMAILDTIIALVILLTVDQSIAWHLAALAIYTLLRGVFDIIASFRNIDDITDRFIWLICGICGCIMGFVIFNAGSLAVTDFIRFFGAYLLVIGVASLIYGVHNYEQKRDDTAARIESAKTKTKSVKKATSRKKR